MFVYIFHGINPTIIFNTQSNYEITERARMGEVSGACGGGLVSRERNNATKK